MVEKEKIIEELSKFNTWWKTGTVNKDEIKEYKRPVFDSVIKSIEAFDIIGLVGARRTGKSTIMMQVVEHLLKTGADPKSILFFRFDNPLLLEDKEIIEKILKIHEEFYSSSEQKYVFFDEIQRVQNWSNWLKAHIDRKEKYKFFVSGSSSTLIYKNTSESLTGRVHFIKVHPFKFSEFCEYREKDIGNISKKIKGLIFNSFEEFERVKGEIEINLSFSKTKILSLLNKYALLGGLPESFEKQQTMAYEWLRNDYIGLVFYKDLLKTFEVRDVKTLEELLYFLMKTDSQRTQYQTLSSALSSRIETIKNYISYLEAANLLFVLNIYSKGTKNTLKSEKKVFPLDIGLKNAIQNTGEDVFKDSERTSKIMESIVASHLFNEFSTLFEKNLYFWRKLYEVDFVLQANGKTIPIEVKYSDDIKNSELKGILKFMEEFKITNGIIITKDVFEKREIDSKILLLVPLWMFLLSV